MRSSHVLSVVWSMLAAWSCTLPAPAVARDAGAARTEAVSSTAVVATAPAWTRCEISVNDCPKRATYAGWTGTDDAPGTSQSPEQCLARAGAYLSSCGGRLPVSATYWLDGRLVAQQIASPLDASPHTELLPAGAAGLVNPRIRFCDGKVVEGRPGVMPDYPNIHGFAPTPWFVTQWKKAELMRATDMSRQVPSTADPVFGMPIYSFTTPSEVSHAFFYPDPTDPKGKRLVFELASAGGLYDSSGGSGEHLTTYLSPLVKLDAPVFLSFNGKLKLLSARYTDANPRSDDVVGLWYSLFTLTFTDPKTKKTTHAFLQMLHADTRDRPPARHADFYQFYNETPATANYLNVLPEDLTEYFAKPSPKGALKPVLFDVARYVCDLAHTKVPRTNGSSYEFPPSAKRLSNWMLSAFAIGLETSDRAPSDGGTVSKGRAEIAYQISDLHLRKYPKLDSSYEGCTY